MMPAHSVYARVHVRTGICAVSASFSKAAWSKKNLTASSVSVLYARCANTTAPCPPSRRCCAPFSLHTTECSGEVWNDSVAKVHATLCSYRLRGCSAEWNVWVRSTAACERTVPFKQAQRR